MRSEVTTNGNVGTQHGGSYDTIRLRFGCGILPHHEHHRGAAAVSVYVVVVPIEFSKPEEVLRLLLPQ